MHTNKRTFNIQQNEKKMDREGEKQINKNIQGMRTNLGKWNQETKDVQSAQTHKHTRTCKHRHKRQIRKTEQTEREESNFKPKNKRQKIQTNRHQTDNRNKQTRKQTKKERKKERNEQTNKGVGEQVQTRRR